MKIKTSELSGPALDWAVTACQVQDRGVNAGYLRPEMFKACLEDFSYSTNWAQGGPIIEREKIATWWATHFIDDEGNEYGNHWYAELRDADGDSRACETGPTPLIAVCRCYVAIKLGDEVEVPDVLKMMEV